MSKILVSVFMLTYNQEDFIAQAIESILMQKSDFEYQLVIGEDCSSDKTRVICEEYFQKFPSRIKLLPKLGKNIGLINNYIRTIKECDGKYIAICDGDDYWIDEFKLQKQVDFLENNSDYSIIYSAIKKLLPNGELITSYSSKQYQGKGFDDLLFLNFIPSVSVLFRNMQPLGSFPEWLNKYPYGDWPTYLWTIKDGGCIHFMADITAVYRFNIGVSSKIVDFNKIDMSILVDMYNDAFFESKKSIINKCIQEKKRNRIVCLNSNSEYLSSFLYFMALFITYPAKFALIRIYLYSLKKKLF